MKIEIIGQMDNTIDHTHESANRVYGTDGIAPTIPTCGGGGIQPKILEVEVIGGMGEMKSNKGTQYYQQDRVYNSEKLSPALNSSGDELVPKIVDIKCVTMRGRNPDNPSDRNAGIDLEQRLEPREDDLSNTLTTVQKDNLVLIKQATKDGAIPCRVGGVADLSYPDSQTRRGRVIENDEVSPTLTTENIPSVLENWIWEIDGHKYLIRIRKLTPRECWRLMDFSDEDFDKAQAVCSNTQLYKQAGNSIVKNILCETFKQFIDQKGV